MQEGGPINADTGSSGSMSQPEAKRARVSYSPPDLTEPFRGSVARRHVFYLPGYDPEARSRYRLLFVRELARYAKRFGGGKREVGKATLSPDGLVQSWRVAAHPASGGAETRYDVLLWDDIVAKDFSRSRFVSLGLLLYGTSHALLAGKIASFYRFNWKYGNIIVYPFVMTILLALATAIIATLVHAQLGDWYGHGLGLPSWISIPLGLAAGFDKDAVAVLPLMRLGFGFVEAGTATPRPQVGNPRPRVFRLEEDRGVINRLGFNNAGLEAYAANLAGLPRPLPAVLGANIGINKDSTAPERDYPALYDRVADLVDYVTVNVSSPNTPGLRDLQGEARLAAILDATLAVRAERRRRPPVLVKIAPDLTEAAVEAVVGTCLDRDVAGLIVSNTTLARPDTLRSPRAREAGGLSGRPLFGPSTELLRRVHRLARGRLVLIGAGGVEDGETAYAKIKAGASLVQTYAGFAYAGPALIPRLKRDLAALLRRDGVARLADAIGAEA